MIEFYRPETKNANRSFSRSRRVNQLVEYTNTTAPIYQRWFRDYCLAYPDVRADHPAIGSGAGLTNLVDGRLDLAGSDLPMTEEDAAVVPEESERTTTVMFRLGSFTPGFTLQLRPRLSETLSYQRARRSDSRKDAKHAEGKAADCINRVVNRLVE